MWNAACCLKLQILHLNLLQVHLLPNGIQDKESCDPPTEQVPHGVLMVVLSDYGAELLKKQQGETEGV